METPIFGLPESLGRFMGRVEYSFDKPPVNWLNQRTT